MTDIESLCRLTEAVEAAGADIAPTYLEYGHETSPYHRIHLKQKKSPQYRSFPLYLRWFR